MSGWQRRGKFEELQAAKEEAYKVANRDALYVSDFTSGTISFRKTTPLPDVRRPWCSANTVTADELRSLSDKIVDHGAPATAAHAREIVMMMFRYARNRGQEIATPADEVRPSPSARFQPRDRVLGAEEVRIIYRYLDVVPTTPIVRLGVKLLLLTIPHRA